MRTKGYKCYNIECGACISKTLCGEPGDTALGCDSRLVHRKTNADHIRSMTDEELAKFIVDTQFNLLARGCEIMGCPCPVTRENLYGDIPAQLEWLKQPYREESW